MADEATLDNSGLMGKKYAEEFQKTGLGKAEFTPLKGKYDREKLMSELFEKITSPAFKTGDWEHSPIWEDIASPEALKKLFTDLDTVDAQWAEKWGAQPYDTSAREQVVSELKK